MSRVSLVWEDRWRTVWRHIPAVGIKKNRLGGNNLTIRVLCFTTMIGAGRSGTHFREMALSYLNDLYSYAVSLCRDQAEAEDLVSEAYLRAESLFGNLPPRKRFKHRLYALIRDIWLERSQRSSQIERRERGVAQAGDPQSKRPQMMPDAVRTAIAMLPAPLREVIFFREFDDLSYREIARALKCPAGTVACRLDRARKELRLLLGARRMRTPRRALEVCSQ
jgi:RNA polymerase sigma-70 factor (ECF subfamily)